MTHPTPPLSSEKPLLDDEDVILLTDEIPLAENHDFIEICQLADPSEPQEVLELSEAENNIPAIIDLSDVIEAADFKTESPPDFSTSEEDILNLDINDAQTPDAEDQVDELQRLIDEVVHDSQAPSQDFSGIPTEIIEPMDSPIVKDELACLSGDKIDAAVERVIRDLFAERIENVLDEVIATTVNREIENLKTILLDHLSGKTVHKVSS